MPPNLLCSWIAFVVSAGCAYASFVSKFLGHTLEQIVGKRGSHTPTCVLRDASLAFNFVSTLVGTPAYRTACRVEEGELVGTGVHGGSLDCTHAIA